MALLRSGQRIAYSVARFGTSIFMNIVTLALYYIYDKEFGLAEDSILNASALAVGKVVIGFSSFIFGYISDILKPSKIGRRKIFIWTGAPLLAFSFVMLMTPNLLIPNAGVYGVFVWLLLWNAFFNLFYGYLLTPYQSWMAEITTPDDRLLTSGLQNTTNVISTLFGIGFAFLLPGILNLEAGLNFTNSMILFGIILAFALIEVVMFLPSLIMIKEENVERKERNVWREFKIVLSNKNYVIWFIAQGIYSMGLTIITSLVIVFSDKILGLTEFYQTLIFGLAVFITLILCFLAWGKIASKIGKKWSLVIGFIFLGIILPFSMIFKVLPASWLEWAGYIYGFLIGVGLSASYLFPYAIVADIAAKDEENTNEPRAGMYNGFNSIPLNICQALAFLLVGFLGKEGYIHRLYWFGLFAALFILLSIPVLYFGNFDPFRGRKTIHDKSIEQNDLPQIDKSKSSNEV
ncbi:MAG: MFS transporter [Candidatus Heimdallarchaeota archaeon]|nr:MFS transporter [Candidatus Heimdallarchaeota archaeon]